MDAFLIYLICFGVGLLFTICTALFGHIFGGHGHDGHLDGSGGHAEAGVDASDMPGVSALSPTVIASFVTAFGGIGMILNQIPATKPPFISGPLSAIGGFAIAGGVLWLLRQLFSRTQSSSESRVGTLVGLTATIITPIPKNGVGEIAYIQAGTRYTAPAREEKGVAVANGRSVQITRVVASQFYVKAV
jgi:membrane protein implicated in regulation of membrane protease activity